MPMVDGKKFPYTPEGEASAEKFAAKKGKKVVKKKKKGKFGKKPGKKGEIGGMLMKRYNEGGY